MWDEGRESKPDSEASALKSENFHISHLVPVSRSTEPIPFFLEKGSKNDAEGHPDCGRGECFVCTNSPSRLLTVQLNCWLQASSRLPSTRPVPLR
jgi:hypothetical protein